MQEKGGGPSLAAASVRPCIVCGSTVWTALPDPGPRSMASDFRIVDEPLARSVCDRCGLARREPASDAAAFFESGYELYAHAPGEARERARQAEYARWIAEAVATRPARVLDVGCGNGSLLRALRSHWPDAALFGCDPSAEAIAHGGGADVRLWRGTLDALPDVVADLVVAINVIEHTTDPPRLLEGLRRRIPSDGTVVVVCPDGNVPGVELLFVDHLFSFAPAHLEVLFQRAGLEVVGVSTAPQPLGHFQMVVGRVAETARFADVPLRSSVVAIDRPKYLQRWRDLDARLLERLRTPAVCFGAGEAAALLRAYAPRSWGLVTACTIDDDGSGTFGDLPIVPLDMVSADATLLLGVRPADQPRLVDRLQGRFRRVLAWYDLVA